MLWFVQASIYIFVHAQAYIIDKKSKEDALNSLETLSSGEKDLLMKCLLNNEKTFRRQIANSSAHSLASKGLVYRANGDGNVMSWPHTIPSFVWDHIKEN